MCDFTPFNQMITNIFYFKFNRSKCEIFFFFSVALGLFNSFVCRISVGSVVSGTLPTVLDFDFGKVDLK